ncbi:MAG: amino acid ABC transporter permease [Lachnospiraceae bacterium]
MESRIVELLTGTSRLIVAAAIKYTIPMTIISFLFAFIIAFVVAIIQISKIKVLTQITSAYIKLFRGTPLMVQLFIVYFGLPKAGLVLDAFVASVIVFSLNVGAYSAETIRAAILSIPKGQWEASTALGMSYGLMLRRIIFPQAMKVAIPSLFNNFIMLVKDTSLASTITLPEMLMVTQTAVATSFEPLWLYSLVAVFYLILCTFLDWVQKMIEKKLRVA